MNPARRLRRNRARPVHCRNRAARRSGCGAAREPPGGFVRRFDTRCAWAGARGRGRRLERCRFRADAALFGGTAAQRPLAITASGLRGGWAYQDLNLGPHPYQFDRPPAWKLPHLERASANSCPCPLVSDGVAVTAAVRLRLSAQFTDGEAPGSPGREPRTAA
jgi:hypothetical protein